MSSKAYWMLGETQQMWLTSLKIAIIEKDTQKLADLMEDIPSLTKLEDIQQARYLLQQATELVSNLKDELAISMKKIEKNRLFLEATKKSPISKLDMKF